MRNTLLTIMVSAALAAAGCGGDSECRNGSVTFLNGGNQYQKAHIVNGDTLVHEFFPVAPGGSWTFEVSTGGYTAWTTFMTGVNRGASACDWPAVVVEGCSSQDLACDINTN